jgi:hypothetical protein
LVVPYELSDPEAVLWRDGGCPIEQRDLPRGPWPIHGAAPYPVVEGVGALRRETWTCANTRASWTGRCSARQGFR